jgi:hypothetical protein
MKGVPSKTIAETAKRYGGPMELCNRLYDGETIAFDLTLGNVSFAMTKQMSLSTRRESVRRIATRYKEGPYGEGIESPRKCA